MRRQEIRKYLRNLDDERKKILLKKYTLMLDLVDSLNSIEMRHLAKALEDYADMREVVEE